MNLFIDLMAENDFDDEEWDEIVYLRYHTPECPALFGGVCCCKENYKAA